MQINDILIYTINLSGSFNFIKMEVDCMQLDIRKWENTTKILTIISVFMVFVNSILVLFMGIIIPGLGPISLGIFSLGLGIRELNRFKENKRKFNMIVGSVLIISFLLNLSVGVKQIQTYIS